MLRCVVCLPRENFGWGFARGFARFGNGWYYCGCNLIRCYTLSPKASDGILYALATAAISRRRHQLSNKG